MIEKLKQIIERFDDLEKSLLDPEIHSDNTRVTEISKERSLLEDVVSQARIHITLTDQVEEYKEILKSERFRLFVLIIVFTILISFAFLTSILYKDYFENIFTEISSCNVSNNS